MKLRRRDCWVLPVMSNWRIRLREHITNGISRRCDARIAASQAHVVTGVVGMKIQAKVVIA